MEGRLVYHPPQPSNVIEEAKALGAEQVWFSAEDETKLHGWFFPHSDAKNAIVYFHGNGEDADVNIKNIARLRDRLQSSIFIFDYRGYGHSAGSPYEEGVVSDGIAAQKWLAKRLKITPDEIVLYGRSLGGAVAVATAEQSGAKAVVVQSTFANMVDIAADRYPFVPVRSLMRNCYLSQQRIAKYDGPFLQFHGTRDTVVPIELARPLCEACPSTSKRFVEINDGIHNGPLPEHCYDTLVEFLDTLQGTGEP
jgi:pimeloyl-ACP methyl ester carboxylesterase